MKIRKGDTVEIISGKDKSKKGKVVKVLLKEDRIIVEKINIIKRHKKKTGKDKEPGGILEYEAPINISNVLLVCPICSRSTRIGYKVDKEGNKTRVCKKCKKLIN